MSSFVVTLIRVINSNVIFKRYGSLACTMYLSLCIFDDRGMAKALVRPNLCAAKIITFDNNFFYPYMLLKLTFSYVSFHHSTS